MPETPEPIILVDSREQRPYRFPGDRVVTLKTGDYTGEAVRDTLRLERKSLADFLGCVGGGRQRFERELERLQAFPARYLVLEFTLADLIGHVWKTWHVGPPGTRRTTRPLKVVPAQVIGSLFAWSHRYGVQPIFAGGWLGEGRRNGQAVVRTLVRLAVREKERAGGTTPRPAGANHEGSKPPVGHHPTGTVLQP